MAEIAKGGYSVEKQFCVRCGKCMTDDDGTTLVGVSIRFNFGVGEVGKVDSNWRESFVQSQFGKYKTDGEYKFCWECFLDSLFGDLPCPPDLISPSFLPQKVE